MEQYRQMYVKRELRRRRIEKRNRVISKVKEGLASIALIIGAEVFYVRSDTYVMEVFLCPTKFFSSE